MKRKLPEIKESLEELKTQLKVEKHGRKKQRLYLLYLLKSGQAKTMKEAGAMLAVDRNTIGRWLADYERGGIEILTEIKTKPNRKLSIPPDVLALLKKKLSEPHNFQSYKDIWVWLKEEQGLDVKYKTVHKIVRYMLKFKLKKSKTSTPRTLRRKRHQSTEEETFIV